MIIFRHEWCLMMNADLKKRKGLQHTWCNEGMLFLLSIQEPLLHQEWQLKSSQRICWLCNLSMFSILIMIRILNFIFIMLISLCAMRKIFWRQLCDNFDKYITTYSFEFEFIPISLILAVIRLIGSNLSNKINKYHYLLNWKRN